MSLLTRVNTLRKKIAIAFIGIISIVGSIHMYYAHNTGYEMLERQAFARAKSVASVVESIFDHLMVSGKHDKLSRVMRNVINTPEVKDVLILKKDGTVSMHAQQNKEYDIFPLDQLKNMEGQHAGRYFSKIKGDSLYFYIAEPLTNKPECYTCHNDPQTVEGFLVVKVEMNDLRIAASKHETTDISTTVFTFLGIGIVLYVAISFLVVQPIHRLRMYIQYLQSQIYELETGTIESLPLPEKYISKSNDEIVDLNVGFDNVVHSLNNAYKKIFALHKIQLGYADRLASTGEIAASVAHEIKNPIAGIVGALQILKSDYPKSNPKHEIIVEMVSQLGRMDQSVNDLLAYARPKPPELSSVVLHDIIERTLSLLSHITQNNSITLETHLDTNGIKIVADPKQIQQVLWNILLNAVQAIEKNGIISISTHKQNDFVHISIQDTGTGINEVHFPNIFKPFYSTKHKGTGLGLSICKQIVEEHHGVIAIQTAIGIGSTVTIQLPIEKSAE
jgi:signal transduction histidine kinase